MADPRRIRERLGFGYGAPSPAMSALEPFHAGVDPAYMPQDVVTESPWEGPREWVRGGLENLFGVFAPNENVASQAAEKVTNLSDWINPAQAGWDVGQEMGNTLQGGDPRMLAMSLIPGKAPEKAAKVAKKAAGTLKDKITDAIGGNDMDNLLSGFERVHDPVEFHGAVSASKQNNKWGPAVELKDVADYPSTAMFLSPDRKTGFAIKPDGDLVSVFSSEKGRLPSIMNASDVLGASKLDAFDTSMSPGVKEGLPQKYAQYGYEETGRMPWDPAYKPPEWQEEVLGEPDVAFMKKPEKPLPPPGPTLPVEGTWGKKDRPDVMFEGVSPHEFTPGQMYRFGEHYGARVPLGPKDELAWYQSLQPFTSTSGKTFQVPGGLESKEPFTYWDDLYMKSQGINPNDLTREQHLALHNRTVAGKQEPPGGWTDAHIFNQLGGMGLLSPNNPLTPNEFAAASVMAKGNGVVDLEEISRAAPGFDYSKHPMYGPTDEFHQKENREALSRNITERLGTQAAERGGTGVSGNQDYTTLVGLAQMMREKPDYFRFRGAGEAGPGASEDTQWLNFVDRLQTQVPGLAGKTGSFGGVWQDPVNAATSAMDRHMLNTFRDKGLFQSPEEQAEWTQKMLTGWNKKNAPPEDFVGPTKPVTGIDELRGKPGGTNYFNDKIFGYVNKEDSGKMRLAQVKGKNFIGPINKPISERAPEHLRPENADYVKEPTEFVSMGPAMRRGIAANKASKEASGATGVFSDQWYQWDPIRNRFEPHEINNPGLTDVPRMSEAQHAAALQQHADLGYLNYSKDEDEVLQPVRPSLFGPGNDMLTPERKRMKAYLKGMDPSKLAYFSMLLGIPISELTEEDVQSLEGT